MCFSKFALGGSDCDYNVSIFDAESGKALGRRWVRRSPASSLASVHREAITQILLRTDGDFMMSMNLSHLEEAGLWEFVPTQVRGSRPVWSGPKYAGSSAEFFAGYNTMALLSDDRTAFYYTDQGGTSGIMLLDADGNVLWDTPEPTGTTLFPGIATDGTDVYATILPDGDVRHGISFSGGDGSEQWRAILGSPVSAGAVVMGAIDGDVFAVGGETGGPIWRFDSSGARVGTGAISAAETMPSNKRQGDYVVSGLISSPSVFVGDTDLNPIISIHMASDIASQGIPDAGSVYSVFADDSGIYIAFGFGNVLAYEFDGTFRWWNRCFTTPGFATTDILHHDGRVYVVHDVAEGQYAPPPFPE